MTITSFETLSIPTASVLARQLQDKKISAVNLVEAGLARISAPECRHAFIKVTSDGALKEARESDRRRAAGTQLSTWDGIPIVWKDLFDVAGVVTTAGSKLFLENPPARQDAQVVAACRKAGMISLGKTNLSEFAFSGLGLNPHFGTPANPNSSAETRAPGGSSSGSAVAVAQGIVPIAPGTDTSGSIRVPASFCGLFGFKASQNRYSRTGCFPLSSSLDSFGGLSHSVDDLVFLDALMRGKSPSPVKRVERADCVFFIPETTVFDDTDDEVLAVFEELVTRLIAAGFRVERGQLGLFKEVTALFSRHGTLAGIEAASLHRNLLDSPRAESMDRRVRQRLILARQSTAADYAELQRARWRLQNQLVDQLGGRFLLFPTVPVKPPLVADLEANDSYFSQVNAHVLRNTMIGSFLGTPGISIPAGTSSDGMPVGVLISAAFGDDDKLLAAAWSLEAVMKESSVR